MPKGRAQPPKVISGWADRSSDKQVGHNPVPGIGMLSCHVPAGPTLASVMLRLLVLCSGTAEPAPLAVPDAGWGEHSHVSPLTWSAMWCLY